MDQTSPTFCVLPWMHMATSSSGNLRLCCNSTPGKNLILDENNKPFRLGHSSESIEKIYNSSWMKDVRQKMLTGRPLSICQRCYTEEGAGVRSARQAWNEKYRLTVAEAVEGTESDGAADFKPIYVDLRLGNLCNLKCRMCNPYASRKWLEDWNKVESLEALPDSESARLATMDWFKNDQFVKNLLPILESVEEVYFTGGEPLLIAKHFELLEALIKSDKASQVKLKYNTNLTFLPSKAFKLWTHFDRVTLNTSIDGVGGINDFIRHPSQWSEIEKNLALVDQFCVDNENIEGSVHTTVQIYNLEHLINLFEYVKNLRGFQRFPYLNILNHPSVLNIRNAPITLKQQLAVELMQWHQENVDDLGHNQQFQKLVSVLDYMNGKDIFEQSEFLKFNSELDGLRGEKLSSVAPRLWQSLRVKGKMIDSSKPL